MKKIDYYEAGIKKTTPIGTLDLKNIYQIIKSDGFLFSQTYIYRTQIALEAKPDFKLNRFPFVTFSGRFEGRTDKGIIEYSQLICIDVDHITSDEKSALFQFIKTDPFTVLAFTSPSEGLKIIIRNDDIKNHELVFNAYRKYAADKLSIDLSKFDPSGKNLSRACFLCSDENVYLNDLVFKNEIEKIPVINHLLYEKIDSKILPERADLNAESAKSLIGYSLNFENKNTETNFRILIAITESKNGRYQSPREPWIQKLACNCNAFGMSEDTALNFCLKHFANHPESIREDKPIAVQDYIVAPIKDSYERYASDFGTWENSEDEEKYSTPTIPDTVYSKLPNFIYNATTISENKRERDTSLLSFLTVLSTCFPEVYGVYDQKIVQANLFLFISAPASAGKGNVSVIRFLGHRIQEAHDDIFKNLMLEYDQEMSIYHENDKKTPMPIKPKRKVFFIPANNSSSKILDQLSINKNFGIIMDTEADTLSQALKQDWGNFSDIIRKVFHHEALEMQRKIGDEYISIQRTALSILLTGTPNQVNNLIKSIENGAFSRFIFYDFPMSSQWKDVFKDCDNGLPEAAYKSMSVTLANFLERIKNVPKKEESDDDFAIEVKMTPFQKKAFNDFFAKRRELLDNIFGENIIPSLHRLGLIGFRIIMILSIIEQIDKKEIPNTIICKDSHFELMLELVDCLTHHTAKIYGNLINQKKGGSKGNKRQRYYNSLPKEFTWAEAKQIAGLQAMTDKSAEYSLKIFREENILDRLEHGSYIKI